MSKKHIKRKRSLRNFAKKMALNPTRAESVLAEYCVRMGLVVEFQKVMSGYILDVYLPQIDVAIEADGGCHFLPEAIARDAARTMNLKRRNRALQVIRYRNAEILSGQNFIVKLYADLLRSSGFTTAPEWFRLPVIHGAEK